MLIEIEDKAAEFLSDPGNMKNNGSDVFAIKIPKDFVPLNYMVDKSNVGLGEINLSCALNEFVYQRISVQTGDEVFIPGYPLRNYRGAYLPIWRRGSLATESLIGMGNYPAFLVDASARAGMSGAPVIRSVSIPNREKSNDELIVVETHFDLIGVYAGRLSSKEMEQTNLGYAWFASEIDAVVDRVNSAVGGHMNVTLDVPHIIQPD